MNEKTGVLDGEWFADVYFGWEHCRIVVSCRFTKKIYTYRTLEWMSSGDFQPD